MVHYNCRIRQVAFIKICWGHLLCLIIYYLMFSFSFSYLFYVGYLQIISHLSSRQKWLMSLHKKMWKNWQMYRTYRKGCGYIIICVYINVDIASRVSSASLFWSLRVQSGGGAHRAHRGVHARRLSETEQDAGTNTDALRRGTTVTGRLHVTNITFTPIINQQKNYKSSKRNCQNYKNKHISLKAGFPHKWCSQSSAKLEDKWLIISSHD